MKKKRVNWNKVGKIIIYALLAIILIEAVLIISQKYNNIQHPDVVAPKVTSARGTPTTTPTPVPTLPLVPTATPITKTVQTTNPTGYVVITSIPTNAFVYIDNKYTGKTPLKIEELAGRHSIELILYEYQSYMGWLNIIGGVTTTLPTIQLWSGKDYSGESSPIPALTELENFRKTCLNKGIVSCSTLRVRQFAEDKTISHIWWNLTRKERITISTVLIDEFQEKTGEVRYGVSFGDCITNAIIRYAVFNSSPTILKEKECKYSDLNGNTRTFYRERPYSLPAYFVNLDNPWHTVIGLQIGEDVKDFDSWRFFQYTNNNIKPSPREQQMGYSVNITVIDSKKILGCSGFESGTTLVKFYVDNTGVVYVE